MQYTPYTLKDEGNVQIWSVRGEDGFRAWWPSRQALEADAESILADHWPGMSPAVRIVECNLRKRDENGRLTNEPRTIYEVEIIIGGSVTGGGIEA